MVTTDFPKIGQRPGLILAPMAGVTDRVFRDLCRDWGADYTVSEMVASKPELWQSAKSSTRHADQSECEPRIVQLLGNDPKILAQAAQWQVDQGAQIIDLNLGCPAKKVCHAAAGSALMAHPKQVQTIFEALVTAVDIPITVKMRTGTDSEHKNALQIAQLAETCGLQAISIHGRTRADKFNGQAEYDTIKQVKQSIQIPVIANGDISSPEDAQFVLEYTACDGLMVGRAAQGNPWIFQAIQQAINPSFLAKPIDYAQVILRHLQGLYGLYGETQGVRIARKHLGWYCQTLTNTSNNPFSNNSIQSLRKDFNRLQTSDEQQNLVEQFFYA